MDTIWTTTNASPVLIALRSHLISKGYVPPPPKEAEDTNQPASKKRKLG
jgi:hypothetical protein